MFGLMVALATSYADGESSVSNLVSSVALWNDDPDRFMSIVEETSLPDRLGDDEREILGDWYLQLLQLDVSTNEQDFSLRSHLKGSALRWHARTEGIIDSTNVWFAVADERAALARQLGGRAENVSTGVVIVATNRIMTMSERIEWKRAKNREASLSRLVGSLDSCLEDFLNGPFYAALPELEKATVRSNLLHRAAISEAEARELGLSAGSIQEE